MEYKTKDLEETAQVEFPDSLELQQAYIKGFTDACFEQDMSELIDFQHTQELEFYRALINYLAEGYSINYPEFFESLAGESEHKYIGKLHGTKYIDDKFTDVETAGEVKLESTTGDYVFTEEKAGYVTAKHMAEIMSEAWAWGTI